MRDELHSRNYSIERNNNFGISDSIPKYYVDLNNQETIFLFWELRRSNKNLHKYNDQHQAETNNRDNSSLFNAGLHLFRPVSILDENLKPFSGWDWAKWNQAVSRQQTGSVREHFLLQQRHQVQPGSIRSTVWKLLLLFSGYKDQVLGAL